MSGGLQFAGQVAHARKRKAAIQSWIGPDLSQNAKELRSLISIGKAGKADLLVVGSEVLQRGDISEAQLLSYIRAVRRAVPSIPVTTAEIPDVMLKHPLIIKAVDIVSIHVHPYWAGIEAHLAIKYINAEYDRVKAAVAKKQVILAEVGFPTQGGRVGAAVPSEANSVVVFADVRAWGLRRRIQYFWFEAFDEPFKSAHEGSAGAHFGLLDRYETPKRGVLKVLSNPPVPDHWTPPVIPGGPGPISIVLGPIPPKGSSKNLVGYVKHTNIVQVKVATLILVPDYGWVSKPFENAPTVRVQNSIGRFEVDFTTGGNDQNATSIAVFAIPLTYDPPTVLGSASIPEEILRNALAHVEIAR